MPLLKMCKIVHNTATQVCIKLLSRNSMKSTFPLPAEPDQEVNPPCFFVYDCWVLWAFSTVLLQNQRSFFFFEIKGHFNPFFNQKILQLLSRVSSTQTLNYQDKYCSFKSLARNLWFLFPLVLVLLLSF